MRAGLAFDEMLFFDCFFPTVLFAAMARLLRDAFFACFEVAVFDFAWLLFVFLFLDGMGAVYHRGGRATSYWPRTPIVLVSSAMPRQRLHVVDFSFEEPTDASPGAQG